MWFIIDGLGISLGLLTWALLAFADWVVVRYVVVTWFWTAQPRIEWLPFTDFGVVVFATYQVLLGLSWFSHLQAMTTDPGTIKQSIAPTDFPNPRCCKLCQGRWKPPRAHHCKTCKVCIFRMDHHCPWINNCVGLANQKLFILFLGYTALAAIVTLILLALSSMYWLGTQKSWSDAAPPGSMALICSGVVAIECLAAILFVGDFAKEQMESIQMNSTLVETYQRTHGVRTDFWGHWRTIFGNSWCVWPWPFATAPPPDYLEPAIQDDDAPAYVRGDADMDGGDSLGIAGEESEAPISDVPASGQGATSRPRQRRDIVD